MKPEDYDIDAYITNKTLDGIFVMIAKEEKKSEMIHWKEQATF